MQVITRKIGFKFIVSFFVLFFLISCGAALDSASDVIGMFKNPPDLEQKMKLACDNMAQDTNFNAAKSNIYYYDSLCTSPPSQKSVHLVDIKNDKDSYISKDLGNENVDTTSGSVLISFRLEVWASSALLELAQKVIPTIKDLKNTPPSEEGSQFTISTIENFKLNENNMTATAKFNIYSPPSSGEATIENNWKLYGKKHGNLVIASLSTYGDPIGESILTKADAAVVVIPHANDVYVDIVATLTLQDRGVNDTMEKKILQMIAKTLYDVKQHIQ